MYLHEAAFRDVGNKSIQVNLKSEPAAQYASWLKDAWHFAQECLPAMGEHDGPLILSGLPLDFTVSLSLAAWYCGRQVVFVDPDFGELNWQTVVSTVCPAMIVSNNPLPMGEIDGCLVFALSHNESGFARWLDSQGMAKPAHEWDERQSAIVLFTSGSTGTPKGVCHSLQNLLLSSQIFSEQFEIVESDRVFNYAPLYTMSGLRCSVFLPLIAGCHVFEEEVPESLAVLLRSMEGYSPTIFIAGPSVYRSIAAVESSKWAESIRFFLSTGAGLSRKVREDITSNYDVPLLDYYGLTETCGIVIAESFAEYAPENISLGKACSGITLKVLNDLNEEMDLGLGELRVYSPALYLGYLAETPNTLPHFDTKDQVEIHPDGGVAYLRRLGREVKSEGTLWISPTALEQFLASAPAIDDFAVRVEPRDERTVVTCYVVPLSEHSQHRSRSCDAFDLAKQLKDSSVLTLGGPYRDVQWLECRGIPRTPLGKIKWKELSANAESI